jgi:hypothetical protein
MFGPPPGTRVFLACGVTDMRNYAEPIVMRGFEWDGPLAAPMPLRRSA